MKCTSKKRAIALVLAVLFFFSACGAEKAETPYQVYSDSAKFGLLSAPVSEGKPFAEDLCVTKDKNKGINEVDSQVAYGALLFNQDTRETPYVQNIYDKLYPASTTKILTAYIALKYGDLNETYVVSQHACEQGPDSSVAKLVPGDQITLNDLLYGLMLPSGNDAAIAIAEGISGSTKKFAKLMNKESKALGATRSHWITPNGLHADKHYTCVYDMYLIFAKAIEMDEFVDIISTKSHTAEYENAAGAPVTMTWNNTNWFLSGKCTAPDGVRVIGGKTGTTGCAGYCLVLLSENKRKERIISIVFHGNCRENLYLLQKELLDKYANK